MYIPVEPSLLQNEVQILNTKPRKMLIGSGGDNVCGLTLQICLIIALSFYCRRWRFDFVSGQVSLAWSIVLRTQDLYTWPRVLKERWREERTGTSYLNFFRQFSHCCG